MTDSSHDTNSSPNGALLNGARAASNTEETAQRAERLRTLLSSKLGSQIEKWVIERGDLVVHVARANLFQFFSLLKLDTELRFNMLVDVTAVDWLDARPERFEVVYHLMSLQFLFRLRVKVALAEREPEVESVSSLWSGALFMERETWDMYGIRFRGHPELRRLLMYDEFKGHPLRKDYPVQGKQPRIPLRAPEVQNTAPDMVRPALVQINRKKQGGAQVNGTTRAPGMNLQVQEARRLS